MGKEEVLQRKYVSILPSKEFYLVPINEGVFHELEETIKQNGYEASLKVNIDFKYNLSRTYQHLELFGKIDSFNQFNEEAIYELQFVQKSAVNV
ncbi:hypothetical protein K2V61_06800 [Staphylococcus simulans]|uniref:hypothetical protein n=1 Tax=Staphylococcus simulans TaxID=1286 RepID=UPI001E5EDD53|nr:hypothetical protein [Staphylococcus simulans]MCD8915249.1 hypothetical protein [Staphylococcus simulans]